MIFFFAVPLEDGRKMKIIFEILQSIICSKCYCLLVEALKIALFRLLPTPSAPLRKLHANEEMIQQISNCIHIT
jgi:hypothetical protein